MDTAELRTRQVVAITGASGYIGSWICRTLYESGHEVVGFSRTPRAAAEPAVYAQRWRQGDITDRTALQEAVAGCSAVVHLAASAQHRSQADPVHDLQVNALGTLQTLTAAQQAGVQRFVLLSSSAVYGAARGRLAEDAPLLPITPYGVSKAAAEAYAGLLARTSQMVVVILRLFNVYGHDMAGRERPTVEARFLQAAAAGRAPIIYGDPHRVYDFIHVSDVIHGILLALTRDFADVTQPAGMRAGPLVLNLGSGQPVALIDLARWCLEGRAPVVEESHAPPTFPSCYADLTRAHDLLGFSPRMDLREWVTAEIRRQRGGPSPWLG